MKDIRRMGFSVIKYKIKFTPIIALTLCAFS